MTLPTETLAPDRDFGGQRYALHRAEGATWTPTADGFERRRFGFSEATHGLAEASVLRAVPTSDGPAVPRSHDGELLFTFVLEGAVTLRRAADVDEPLHAGDSFVMPAHEAFALVDRSTDLQLLRVELPAGRD
jgi:mannose-6-phosphate isomerase-like protein (cupin superfamily)